MSNLKNPSDTDPNVIVDPSLLAEERQETLSYAIEDPQAPPAEETVSHPSGLKAAIARRVNDGSTHVNCREFAQFFPDMTWTHEDTGESDTPLLNLILSPEMAASATPPQIEVLARQCVRSHRDHTVALKALQWAELCYPEGGLLHNIATRLLQEPPTSALVSKKEAGGEPAAKKQAFAEIVDDVALDDETIRVARRIKNTRRGKIALALGALAIFVGLGVNTIKKEIAKLDGPTTPVTGLATPDAASSQLIKTTKDALVAISATDSGAPTNRGKAPSEALDAGTAPEIVDSAAPQLAATKPDAAPEPPGSAAVTPDSSAPVEKAADAAVTATPEAPAAPAPREAAPPKVTVKLVISESAMGGIRVDAENTAKALGAFTLVSDNQNGNVVLKDPTGKTYTIPRTAIDSATHTGEVEFEAAIAE